LTLDEIYQEVENEIFDSVLDRVYLPIVPLELDVPCSANTILRNPRWLIRTESLIDEKILGN
jgi:hypothetical protein